MRLIVKQTDKDLYPIHSTEKSAGADVKNAGNNLVLNPGESKLLPTGLWVIIPDGFELQVRPRSGLALKKSITVLNSPGTIDADYRSEIGVILINHGKEPVTIEKGERIAQLVLARYESIEIVEIDQAGYENFDKVARVGGFGSTGTR